jgi:hypothetical protein
MMMPEAGTVIGLAPSFFDFGVAVHLGVDGYIKLKRFEREQPPAPGPTRNDALLATRLDRIEQVMEATSLEVERITEGQRFLAKTVAEPRAVAPPARAPERVITPH